jgi:hypothetical protein
VRIDDAQGHEGFGGVTPFKLWPAQVALAGVLQRERLVQILKARQLGISWLVCADKLRKCLELPNRLVLLLSKGQREANEMLRRIRVMYRRLPPWLKRYLPGVDPGRDNKSELGFTNGSVVYSLPASESSGVSFTASDVVIDEAAHLSDGGPLYANVKPAIDDGGPDAQMVVLSTANGLGDFFHRLWAKSVSGESGFRPVFLPWWARPGRDRAWYDRKVAESDEPALVPQNYPANATEAFVSSGRMRYDPAWVAAQAANARQPVPAAAWPASLYARKGWPGLPPGALPATLADVPRLRVYAAPEPGRRYAVAADVAEGKDPTGSNEPDYSAAVVADRDTGEEVASLHGRWEPDVFAVYLMAVSEPYNRAPVVVERNNHGHAVLATFRNLHFPAERVGLGHDGARGWLTNGVTKPRGEDLLASALRQGLVAVRTAAAVGEMQVYSVLKNGSTGAPAGFHDDYVLAWQVLLQWCERERLRSRGSGRAEVDGAAPRLSGLLTA